jgi:hypothetical protein
MNPSETVPTPKRKRRWIVVASLAFIAGVTGLVLWISHISHVSHDLLFRGKPESEWIKHLKYSDNDQVKEWQGYGEEGIQVLIRGLKRANPPGERTYRKFNRRLPALLRKWLPAAKPDNTSSTRLCIVSLAPGCVSFHCFGVWGTMLRVRPRS